MRLGEMLIEKGETVLVLHLWSERLPPFAPAGPDMAWAAQTARQFRQSLAAMAGYIQRNPQLSKARALMGVTALFPPPREGQRHPMERFGFTVVPYRGPLGRFGEFWENFYSWLLIWTYHPNSAGSQRLVEMRRTEIWIPIAEMIARYGEKSTP